MTVNVAVCFAANEGYMQHATTAIYSFVKNNQTPWYDLFLLSNDATAGSIAKLNRSLQAIIPGIEVIVLKVNHESLSRFKGHIKRLTVQTYYRLLIPELLPQYEYAMYLDSDIVVLNKISFPFNQFNANVLLASKDYLSVKFSKERGLTRYFNAGVLFINLREWRNQNVFRELSNVKPPIALYADQEILNEYFHETWIELSSSYNFPAPVLRLKNWFKLRSEIFIMHYVGPHKPWEYFRLASLYYWYYLIQTEYRIKIYTVLKTPWNSLKYLISKKKKIK